MKVLVDIDYTIAINKTYNPRRKRLVDDWNKFCDAIVDDKPINETVQVLQSLQDSGHEIVFVSGRTEECRKNTANWLVRQNLTSINYPFKLILRDGSHGHEIPEYFKLNRAKEIRPDLVIEDDEATAKVLSKEGFNVLQFRQAKETETR